MANKTPQRRLFLKEWREHRNLTQEQLADRIGIIAGGRLLAEGRLDELRAQAGGAGGHSTLEDGFLQLTAESAPA